MNPVDVVGTRFFRQSACPDSRPYNSALDCFEKTVRAEGARGLSRGLGANLARVVPHTVLTFALVESLRDSTSFLGSLSQTLTRALHHNRGAP
jgi:hypothetical protein